MLRRSTAESRIRVREKIADTKIDDALVRYETIERKVDELEAQVESYDLGRKESLTGQIEALEAEEAVEKELAELKRRVKGGSAKPAAKPGKPAAASTDEPGETE
jgi:phage shock protein A